MKFQKGQTVMVLDAASNQVAGSGIVISFNEGLYKVLFRYANSEKQEEIEVPEQRLITSVDIAKKALNK